MRDPSTAESPPAEANPWRAFWTRSRLTLAVTLGAIVLGVILWPWPGGGTKNTYVFVKASYGTVTVSARNRHSGGA